MLLTGGRSRGERHQAQAQRDDAVIAPEVPGAMGAPDVPAEGAGRPEMMRPVATAPDPAVVSPDPMPDRSPRPVPVVVPIEVVVPTEKVRPATPGGETRAARPHEPLTADDSASVAQGGWPSFISTPGGEAPVTKSSNLGWPGDDQTPNDEHLGWAEIVFGALDDHVEQAGLRELAGSAGLAARAGSKGASSGDGGGGNRADARDEEARGSTADAAIQVAEKATEPVDNSVGKSHEKAGFMLDSGSERAGENAVDELPPMADVSRETKDREELAAVLPQPTGDTPVLQELAENARRRIHLSGQKFPKPKQPRVLTVANQKGGVGKTTTTVNVAAAMAQAGLRVLVVDLDPQGNASTALGIDHHADVVSIYDVLVDSTPLLDVIQPCTTVDNLYCAPATIDLAGAEIELVSLVARETRLQKAINAAIEKDHGFDYILIDCPPSLGLLTVNAMVAATEVFIPIQCEYYALEGLSQLLKNIELVRAHLNPALHVSTILLTMYDGRTRLSAQVADEVREHFPAEVLRTTVPRSVRVSEAPSFGETVMTYDPHSSGALSYLEAANEIAQRGAAGQN